MGNARRVGVLLKNALLELAARYRAIADVRGVGLFIGAEMENERIAARIVNGLRERRILISATGPGANILKIRPPLVFSEANLDQFISALGAELAVL